MTWGALRQADDRLLRETPGRLRLVRVLWVILLLVGLLMLTVALVRQSWANAIFFGALLAGLVFWRTRWHT